MKQVIKKIIFYDKLYPIIKSSFFYQYWKKGNALIAQAINNNPAKDFFIFADDTEYMMRVHTIGYKTFLVCIK